MKDGDTVTDPTDWASTAASDLQPVESALRCQVCKEFYDTPMITSCAHTFCSLCIRRCLSHDGKCPTCRGGDQPIKLRRNWAVEDAVNAFKIARPALLQLGKEVAEEREGGADGASGGSGGGRRRRRRGGATRAIKRKLKELSVDSPDELSSSRRKTRSSSRRALASKSPSVHEVSDIELVSEKEDPSFEPDDGKVACPICQTRMKEEDVFTHIGRDHSDPTPSSRQSPSMLGLRQMNNASHSETKTQERLSQLNYSLLSDTALRKKLAALGIPSQGNKQLMVRRHKEWVDLYNANCDATKPRSKRDLLRELDVWEKTQGSAGHGKDDANGIMSKDFDGAAWAQKNDTDFKDLIAKARAKKAPPAPTPPPPPAPETPSESEAAAVVEASSTPINGEERSTPAQIDTPMGVGNSDNIS